MDRRLLNYLPPVLREVLEIQTINKANEPEIAVAWDALTLVLANQFLDTADENGVSVWERELRMLVLMTAFLHTYGTITHGAYTEQSSYMEIWPQIISELESQGAIVMAGPLEYHACVEIYPKEE